MRGSFHVFALEQAPLGFPPKWNTDPRTGTTAPLVFGKSLDYRNPRNVGDIKYLWEINRHLELVTLAQAWHLSGDARYLDGCRTLLDSWFEHYNTVHPHKALGYRSPREFRKRFVDETTENAVGAVRRPHGSTLSAEAVGSRPQPPQAVARSASLDASAAVDQP